MPNKQFDRSKVKMKSLTERKNKKRIKQDHVLPTEAPKNLNSRATSIISDYAGRIRKARKSDKPVMLAFGAHAIKNGLAPVLIHLIEKGWLTHLATNGAGIIHDWEFAYQGQSSEDVRANVAQGQFGNWQETGFYLNLAILIGAYKGKGYGESVGAMIANQSLTVPTQDELQDIIRNQGKESPEKIAAACDLLHTLSKVPVDPGQMEIPHPYKQYSVQAKAYELGVPFTGHPMFGHDIIYNHPANNGAAIGRAAQRDFLTFAKSVSRIEGGVYLSVGSAVMSPMIFEKSFSMAQNVALQEGRRIENHSILVVDLAKSTRDWSQGEPPEDNPDYYLRYNKTFSRMGGTMQYVTADNRDFLLALGAELSKP